MSAAHVIICLAVAKDFLHLSKPREQQSIFRKDVHLGRKYDKRGAEMTGLREN